MFLDRLVCGFASDTGFDRFHHDGGGHKEGEVVGGFCGDDRRIGVHLIEDGEESFKHAVDGEEGIGQHHAAHDRAGNIAFVPLIAGEGGCHGEMAFEDGVETIDAFAGARVHFVRHRTRAGLARCKTFTGGFVTCHEAQRAAE